MEARKLEASGEEYKTYVTNQFFFFSAIFPRKMKILKMSLTDTFIDLAERGMVPDFLIRAGIRNLCRKRLQQCPDDCEANAELVEEYMRSVDESPLAVLTDKANEQHYEVPAAFYHKVLGKNFKYSSCYFEDLVSDLTTAEDRALELTCEHADLQENTKFLNLDVDGAPLSLWMAKNFPKAKITSVSNSNSQREYIMGQAKERKLENLTVITADVNGLSNRKIHTTAWFPWRCLNMFAITADFSNGFIHG